MDEDRLFIRGVAAAFGVVVGGPPGGVAAWKLSGFATSGNPLHLLPGGSAIADAADVFLMSDDAGVTLGGHDQTPTKPPSER